MSAPRLGFVVVLAIAVAIAASVAPADPKTSTVKPTLDSNGEIKVPEDLPAALVELKKMLDPELLDQIRDIPEDDIVLYHHGLGTWLRNNWGLWKGSVLSNYFNQLDIFHPDDMSGIVLDSLWRDLHSEPIRLEEQVAYYKEYWRQNSYPAKAKCPEHRSRLEQYISMLDPVTEVRIHVFKCRKKSEIWIWQVDRGFYKPSDELLKAINDD